MRNRSQWTPDEEPYGALFIQSEAAETLAEGAGIPSELNRALSGSGDGKSYMLVKFDRKAVEGRLVHMGWKIRQSKDEDVCMALDVIIQLMKEAGIGEVCDTDEVRGRKRRARGLRLPKRSGPGYRDA